VLDISQRGISRDNLLPVLTANAGSLRELHLQSALPRPLFDLDKKLTVEAIVAASPMLQVLTVDFTWCTWEDAPQMLRAQPPFATLQMRHTLSVRFSDNDHPVGGMERFGPFAAALADATLQPAPPHLYINGADMAQLALMGALADVAVARRLRGLTLDHCTPPAAASLARLLAGGCLAHLQIKSFRPEPMFDEAGAALVADALRVNTTLTKLELRHAGLCHDMRAASALLGALVGHPSLRELAFIAENTADEDRDAFGAALAAVIAADATALQVLDCCRNHLGDAGLAPIVEALALNHHLYDLDIRRNGMSEALARDRLLPAVRANTTLQGLWCDEDEAGPAAKEAEELVRLREQHD